MREIKEAEMGEFRPFVKQGAARPHLVDDSQEREKFAVRDSGTISAAKRFADGVADFRLIMRMTEQSLRYKYKLIRSSSSSITFEGSCMPVAGCLWQVLVPRHHSF